MTTPTPIIQVSHLPSASSFYASLTQPLGLRYLSATTTFPATLHFGLITDVGKEVLFSITQSPAPNPPTTNIYLPAPSPKAVQDFHNKSRLLNPGSRENAIGDTEEGEKTKATTRDLDGNMLEAVYSSRGARRVQLETASTEKEARRVLEWQKDVAKSVSAEDDTRSQVSGATETIYRSQVPPARADSYPQPMRLVKRETVTEHYQHHDGQPQAEASSRGMSGKAIIGTLLGAAAGAAVAYAMVRSESPQRHSAGSRRASATGIGYTQAALPPPVEMVPARSYVSARDEDARPRYVQYTIAQPSRPPPLTRAHTTHELGRIEERSHVSSQRSGRSEHRSTRERSRSEHGSRFERPLTIMPAPRASSPGTHVSHRSHKSHHSGEGSHHSSPRSHASGSHHSGGKKSRRSSKYHDSERESYASARSHTSESTVKISPSRTGTTTIKIVGKDGERQIDDRRSYVSARDVPLPRSIVSVAREVPLPHSVVGGYGYAASVAPSDSVSSVGSKRERERLSARMTQRW